MRKREGNTKTENLFIDRKHQRAMNKNDVLSTTGRPPFFSFYSNLQIFDKAPSSPHSCAVTTLEKRRQNKERIPTDFNNIV
jgi:hypothetical protein